MTSTLDRIDAVSAMVAAEQAAFVSLAGTLTADQLAAPSLCAGWTVREVILHSAAHIHGAQRDAAALAEHRAASDASLIAWLAAPVKVSGSRSAWFRAVDAEVQLGELLIHHQDVVRALELTREIPGDHLLAVLNFGFQRFGSIALAGARRRVRGLHVVATDPDWSFGRGPQLRGAAEAVVMATAGRRAAVPELTGEGVSILLGRTRA